MCKHTLVVCVCVLLHTYIFKTVAHSVCIKLACLCRVSPVAAPRVVTRHMGPPPRRISTRARAPVSRARKPRTHLACCDNILCLSDGAGRDGFRVRWHIPSLPWEGLQARAVVWSTHD